MCEYLPWRKLYKELLTLMEEKEKYIEELEERLLNVKENS